MSDDRDHAHVVHTYPGGPGHLSVHGPVTLCGIPIDLATVRRSDLVRLHLIGPDTPGLCPACVLTLARSWS